MNKNSIVRNILFSLITFVIFLLLLEGGMRLYVVLFNQRVTKPDPDVGWYHQPNSHKSLTKEGHSYNLSYNSHGFRVPEHTYKKPKGVRRVVILGDSFVDGSEVDDRETFSWLMQEELDSIEVINLGVYGYSTTQELFALKKFALRYDPDIVLVMTMTNDFTDNLLNFSAFGPCPRYTLKNDSLVLENTNDAAAQEVFAEINLPVPAFKFFHQHSYLYYALNQFIYQRLYGQKIEEIIKSERTQLNRQEQEYLYLQIIEKMKRICDQSGIDFWVFFVYPQKQLLDNELSPSLTLIEQMTEKGVNAVDLFQILRNKEMRSKKDESLYYVKDFHWNARGHKYVSELMIDWVKSWENFRVATKRPAIQPSKFLPGLNEK